LEVLQIIFGSEAMVGEDALEWDVDALQPHSKRWASRIFGSSSLYSPSVLIG
jgi:nuclear pore complex protein Nup205